MLTDTHVHVQYVKVGMVARTVQDLGTGTLMAKVDTESAYCLIPVHPDNHPLLGFQWRGSMFCDAMLPSGLL